MTKPPYGLSWVRGDNLVAFYYLCGFETLPDEIHNVGVFIRRGLLYIQCTMILTAPKTHIILSLRSREYMS